MSKHDKRDERAKARKDTSGKAGKKAKARSAVPVEAAPVADPIRRTRGPLSALAVLAGAALVALATAALRLRR